MPGRSLGILLFALLVGSSGCQHHRASFYPLGIFSDATTNSFATLREAGFNIVQGPAQKGFLDAASASGLKVLASPGTSAGTNFNALTAQRVVAAIDSHPALWAWYLVDEPDLNRVSPTDVIAAHRFLRRSGARKPTALVIYQGATALHYANIADITMIDRYPIPWLPLANVPQHVQKVRLALGKTKPLIAVIQTFDWNAYAEQLPGEKDLRPPTYEELRCMTYCALAQRATGLFYFAFETPKWKMEEQPETWDATKKVLREVNERLPLFQAEHLWWPVIHQFGDPTIRFNEALESSITSTLLRVRRGNDAIPPGEYILAVNTTNRKQTYSFWLPERRTGAVWVLGENRLIAIQNTWVTDRFEPYAVRVFEVLPRRQSSHLRDKQNRIELSSTNANRIE
jgi:hypothetical protein